MEFIDFINLSKYYSASNNIKTNINFRENQIMLLNNSEEIYRYYLPKNIRIVSFTNNPNNNKNELNLSISNKGLINIGTTITYKNRLNELGKITIGAAVGDVNFKN